MALINGDIGSDTLLGDPSGAAEADIIFGLGSSDSIEGLRGNDILFGGSGNDEVLGGSGKDTVEGGSGGDTLDGGAGRDLLSYAQSAAGVDVSLATGSASGGDAAGDSLSGFENLHGSQANDSLAGDGGRNDVAGGFGNDQIRGNGGDDTLRGDAGADTLRGDAGADVFLYFGEADSTVGNPDQILDFVQGDDLIDLSAIDADATTVGVNESFTPIVGAFTGTPRELRDNGVALEGDTDGDGAADFAIDVFSAAGGVALTAADIVL